MQKELLTTADKLNKRHKKEGWWKRFVRAMSMLVVFCTTYALILPAITIDMEPFCGIDAHVHGENCYEIQEYAILDCGVTRAIHSHDDFCLDGDGNLVCTLEESRPHVHEDGCYEIREGHSHLEECFDEAGELICQLEEVPEETVLSCSVEDPAEHQHDDSCWGIFREEILVCEQPEHIHDNECMADPDADVEDASDWEATFSHLTLTDSWAENMAAIAGTQIGYTESERNFIVDGAQKIKGYSRYGAWYGTPYAQWDVTFASFCMEYAGAAKDVIAGKGKVSKWTEQLETVTRLQSIENYLPEEGDLVFFLWNGGETCGIVSLVDDGYYRVIAGDVDNQVRELELEAEELLYSCDIRTLQEELETLPEETEITEATEPTGETEATEPTGETEATEPTEATEATEPAETTEPTGETEATEPTEEAESTEPTEVTETTEATEATEATEPTEATEATEPTEETEATEPTEVTETTEPAEETEATEPTGETEPAATEEKIVCVAETENYIVTVSYSPSLILPEGTELRVVEYARDSEVFRQRCREAGYELEWLLNIGFFLENQELDLNGQFDVVVTGKQGNSLGTDITHFADSGTERITGTEEEDGAVSFSSEGFSDFGGGVALAAAQTATVNFGLYSYNEYCPINLTGGNTVTCDVGSVLTLTLKDSGANYHAPNLTITGGELVAHSYGCSVAGCSHSGWCTNPTHTILIRVTGTTVNVSGQINGSAWNNSSVSVTAGSGGTEPPVQPETPVEPEVPEEPEEPVVDTSYPRYPNYPHAVHTGEVNINRLRFYNLCEGNGGISALAGCEFLIEGPNGYSATVISGGEPEVNLPGGMADGIYTITEISTPDGYMRDTKYQRTFRIRNGNLDSGYTIGTFINHNLDRLKSSKTGEVEDYNNRIYQILFEAESNMRLYEMEPIDVLFVVDKSNSMLFPAGMNDTGFDITLQLDGSGNITRNQAVFDQLDKSQVYYVVADPTGSATAWAIWYNGNTWLCQDASYYAKAKHDNVAGYQTPDELAIFPNDDSYSNQPKEINGQTVRANGAGLSRNLSGSSLGKDIDKERNDIKTYTLYSSKDQYNRLHYLEESLSNIIYALADANPQNRITLVPFTKTVQTTIPDPDATWRNISMPVTLNGNNPDKLVDVVTHINTSGGTRQDLALEYTYNTYLRNNQDGKTPDHTYTILITDGAPVESDDKSLTQIYNDIRYYGGQVKQESTLMSVALGMDTVVGGSAALRDIASSERFYCALEDASELIETMQDVLFEGFTQKQRINMRGDLVDEITDSFYPIAWVDSGQAGRTGRDLLVQDAQKDWILLQAGDWITTEGRFTVQGAANAAGQLLRKEDGTFYIQWQNLPLSREGGWKGTFYVKAKEDFIGGNAILTNKNAKLVSQAVDDLHPSVEKSFDSPTVNVHLLDMNEMHSEVTVYLGDLINSQESDPLDSLQLFYYDTRVEKILSGTGNVLNRYGPDDVRADGLGESEFTLKYAIGRDLTEAEWKALVDGQTITIPYIFDNMSSHGTVGEFTFRLTKEGMEGASPGFDTHKATAACQPDGQPLTENCHHPAETYILHIDYRAYALGEQGRPGQNVNNGSGSPGTQVGTGSTLATGLGTVEKDNVHEVHVISGSIRILKTFEEGLTSEQDETFTFRLHRQEDGEDTSGDQLQTITIPAGQSAGSAAITFTDLPRGTYTVTEEVHEIYMVKEITVTDQTNTYSTPAIGESAQTLTFTMGHNTANQNVIGYADADARYTSYLDPVNGVFGEAVFTNEVIVYYGDVPVEKYWDDGAENHTSDAVYVVLYLDDKPVLDSEGRGRLLRLDASNDWKGSFRVVLADKEDVVTNYAYSVREAHQVVLIPTNPDGWHLSILENDAQTLLYYDRALDAKQILDVGGIPYAVWYTAGENGGWIVENYRSVELPNTGGIGTSHFTFGGLLLMAAAAIMYSMKFWRKHKKGGAKG